MNQILLALINSDVLELAPAIQSLGALIKSGDLSVNIGNNPHKGVCCVFTFPVGIAPVVGNDDDVLGAVRVCVIEARARGLVG